VAGHANCPTMKQQGAGKSFQAAVPTKATPVVLPEMPKRDKATPPNTNYHLAELRSHQITTSSRISPEQFQSVSLFSLLFGCLRYDVLLPDGAFSMQIPAACPAHVPALLSTRTHRADMSRFLIPNDAKPPAERFRSARYTHKRLDLKLL
jgi:hypothetical protein